METFVCVQCRSQLRPGAKFCPVCGAAQPPSPTRQCPHCLSPLRAGAKFCPACGQAVSTSGVDATFELYCPDCKMKLRRGSQFCPGCGRQVNALPVVQAQPQPASLSRHRRWMLIAAIAAIIIFTVIGTLVTIRNKDLGTPETAIPRVAATLTAQAATPTLRAP